MSTTATIATELPRAITSYADRLHKYAGGDNHIVSPLGAWMLLALCARGSDGRLRDELTKALGMDVDLAATAVASLLEKPHPAVATGAGIWTSRTLHVEGLAPWLAQLPVPVDRGEIPSKAALDEWTAKRTLGMIRTFPLQLSPETVLVLATTLATKVEWVKPFRSVPAGHLAGRTPTEWSRRVERVLQTPSQHGHTQFIARTDRAGDVCVHAVMARPDLVVTSVIAEGDVRDADVIAAAYELAVATMCDRPIAVRSLFDLPLGDSPLWTVTEEEMLKGGREEICTAVLPAWSGQVTNDLGRAELGFPAAAAWLAQLTGSESLYGYEAKQSVVARYNRRGFEAAAVSAMGVICSAMWQRKPGRLRRATLRFGHPFAVVAVTRAWTDWVRDRSGRTRSSPFWYGLPVYSAWVTVPTEAEENSKDDLQDPESATLRKNPAWFVESAEPVDSTPAPPIADLRPRALRTPSSRARDWIKGL